jgi:hypothetical protein
MILQTPTLPAPANDIGSPPIAPRTGRGLSVDVSRRGVFAKLGRLEAYLCSEAEVAWFAHREPGGCDLQFWRLHLMVGRSPS